MSAPSRELYNPSGGGRALIVAISALGIRKKACTAAVRRVDAQIRAGEYTDVIAA